MAPVRELLETMLQIQELQLVQGKKPARNPTLAALRGKVPPPILAHLDRLIVRGKKGVAIARNFTCSECHMKIPVGTVTVLMRGGDIQLCGSCGRYLHLEAALSPGSPAAAPPAKSRTAARKPRRPAAPDAT
jgi:hypothetical protein